jgi:hypothetical protein
MSENTALCVATDVYDEHIWRGRLLRPDDIDAMMAYAARLGATRYEWVLDTMWNLYRDYAGGFDLLATAREAAHRHGLRFDVVFKPFEGGLVQSVALPHTFPRPEGVPLRVEYAGLLHVLRPAEAERPDLRIAREPGEEDPGGSVRAIRLVKADDGPLRFDPRALQLEVSATNGGFARYDGPMTVTEERAWRPRFPYGNRPCRVITLGDLALPEEARYFVVRCPAAHAEGNFTNEMNRIMELVNERGETIPHTPSLGPANAEQLYERTRAIAERGLTAYVRQPEVKALIEDRERFLAHARGMQRFDLRPGQEEVIRALDRDGEVAAARGKPACYAAALHPIYEEARAAWLETVRFCIEQGVDGVNFRVANHHRPHDPWAYGFNEAVRAQARDPRNSAEIARINGNAYTQFLREASELLHKAGREIGVHVHALMLHHDDRGGPGPLPRHFEWQWETWLKELADYAEFRGATLLTPYNVRKVVDRIGLAAREAGVPLTHQSTRTVVPFEGPHPGLARELDWVRAHPDIHGYNLYETAHFMRLDEHDRMVGSEDLAEAVRAHWGQMDLRRPV